VILSHTCQISNGAQEHPDIASNLVPFGVTYDKIGTIQRRLAWPLHKDDTLVQSGSATADNIFCHLRPLADSLIVVLPLALSIGHVRA
jgi:hypothetical protein